MHRSIWTLLLAIGVGMFLVAGCEKKEQAPKVATPSAADVSRAAAEAGQAAQEAGAAAAETGAAAAATTEAQQLLDQAMQYIKDKKWDLAEGVLKKLDALKDKLPAEWASKIGDAHKALSAAKAASGAIQLP